MKVNAAPTPPTPLKLARLTRGYTLLQVAVRTDTDPAEISKMERGIKSPDPLRLRKFAEVYGVDPQDLV